MKKWLLILLLVLPALSCVREQEADLRGDDDDVGGAPVEIVFTLPSAGPSTKAIGEDLDATPLNTLHLAVFGSSGYLKEYVQAQPLERDGDGYTFRVSLTISDNPRTVHFIGNGPASIPFGYAHAVVPPLLSEDGEGSYWQMVSVPRIAARKDSEGDYINAGGDKITDGTGYVADDATLAYFQDVPLIRNWAKIVVMKDVDIDPETGEPNDPYFEPISYAVINVPSRGSVAPHSSTVGFVSDYQEFSFADLSNMGYVPNLPAGTEFSSSIPTAEDFANGTGGVALMSRDNHAVYLYERPVPSENFPPSYVIIYGTYLNPDPAEEEYYGKNYYYKVDLMENAEYYPVFRNFKYQIRIHKIRSHGQYSPAAAATAAGSADVSADINTRSLNDISDGQARLVIRPWMAQTFTSKQTDNTVLHAFFMSDVTMETVDMEAGNVTVELLPRPYGAEDIIEGLSIDAPEADDAGQRGWRTIHFSTKDPNQIKAISTQTIRISGYYQSGQNVNRLYRDVDITIQPIQPMLVSCGYHSVPNEKGSPQTVTVSIPDGLVESMFPLQFQIEAEDMSLTPDDSVPDNNLPVEGGVSISGSGKSSFHFVRTLSWSEYESLAVTQDGNEFSWRSFTCYFKTNRDDSGSNVWVANQYFETAYDSFVTTADTRFPVLKFSSTIPRREEARVTVDVELRVEEGRSYPADFPVLTFSVFGMTPLSDMVSYNEYSGKYTFRPQEAVFTLEFITTTDDGDLEATFEAEDYTTQTIRPYRFTDFGFVDGHSLQSVSGNSNVVLGYVNRDANKTVLFQYHEDPDALDVPIWLEDMTDNLLYQSPSSYPAVGLRNTNASSPTFRELDFKTIATVNTNPVSFTLCAIGYVEESVFAKRFNGQFWTQDIGNYCAVFNGSTTYTTSGSVACKITFSEISAFNDTGKSQGIILAAGGTYTIDFELQDSDRYLYYVQLRFRPEVSGVNLYPEEVIPSVGTFSQWGNNNNDFIWNLPAGTTDASLTIKTADDVPANLYFFNLKTYKASFYQ